MTTPHPHAEILRAIADGKAIQKKYIGQDWTDCPVAVALTTIGPDYPCKPAYQLRVKPDAITVNRVECPKPLEQNIHTGSWISIETNGHLFKISFAKAADAKTVYDALCKPFKEGV